MTPEKRAIEALARALHEEYWDHPWDEADEGEMATDRYSAAAIWFHIDRDALRTALLAEVRREVEELPWAKADGSDLDGSEGGLFVDADEFMEVVDRADVLRLLGDPRRP